MPASFAHVANKLINSVFINPPLPPSLPQPLINTLSEEIQLSGKRTDQSQLFFRVKLTVYVYIFIYTIIQQIFTRYFLFPFHSSISSIIVDNYTTIFLENFTSHIKDCRRSSSLDRRKQVYLEARVP